MSRETTTVEETKQSHSEQQAWAQLSGICEMVAKLTREGAAREYVKQKSRAELLTLTREAGLSESWDDGPDDALREDVAQLISDETIEPDDFKFDQEAAHETIQEDALSVEVREPWHDVGQDDVRPEEFCILLCTGGPAVRIRGELDAHLQPHRAWIEHQDWGTPWTQIFGLDSYQQEALLTYCQQFFFGE
jgi:hypothetical protein